MQTAIRPRLTSGIAALGATAVIATTITVAPQHTAAPALPAIPTISSSVELTSLVNPFAAFGEVLQQGLADVRVIGQNFLANPAPVAIPAIGGTIATIGRLGLAGEQFVTGLIKGIVTEVPPAIQNIVGALKVGDFATALSGLVSPLIGIGLGIQEPIQTLFKTLATPFTYTANLLGNTPGLLLQALANFVAAPAYQTLNAVGTYMSTLAKGVVSLNLGKIYNAVVGGAATFAGSLTDMVFGQYGIVNNLLNFRQSLASALTQGPVVAAATPAAATKADTTVAAVASSPKALTLSAAATAAAVGGTATTTGKTAKADATVKADATKADTTKADDVAKAVAATTTKSATKGAKAAAGTPTVTPATSSATDSTSGASSSSGSSSDSSAASDSTSSTTKSASKGHKGKGGKSGSKSAHAGK